MRNDEHYYSVAELLQLKLPNYPLTRQGWDTLVKRDGWEFREVKGFGGPGGIRREYMPPKNVMSLIDNHVTLGVKEMPGVYVSNSLEPGFIEVPWASAAAGHGRDNNSSVAKLSLREAWIRSALGISPAHLGLVTVTGDSMYPTLVHGEVVCVDTGVTEFKDDACYVINIGGFERIKRLQLMTNGNVLIKSDNDHVEPENLTMDEAMSLKVIGLVLPVKLGFFKL
ncbi:S24 family peptidase [Ferriphaselus sp. R-1]|uniref:S24 family peptidase n=1 Tax=Ferriphaselus sp. R-1 TaxID=1485544 RepID=UPI0006915B7B|nr:S24 family peptidase [Ferriphaselus sp. R-1]